ncbi:MAG: hypothetical protein ACPIOQ_29540, partial [Promethearchaeia archaeon]
SSLGFLVVPRPRPAAFRRVPTASLLLLVEPDRSPRPATAGDPATSLATDESHLCPHHACEIPERNRLAIALRCAAACSRHLQSPKYGFRRCLDVVLRELMRKVTRVLCHR